ncbi:RAI1 like PD-(D/E)XK nuclease domain-containing protein [Phthorimaea operculella]|nr:RAI1 like PD-(D/E)XK nuclease domain-containing protein [Phthorimaea operculella]
MNNPTLLSVPYVVGYMSVDVNREYHPNLSELKFVNHIPRGRVSLNLDYNVNNAIKRTTDDNDEKIDLLLKYLLDRNEPTPHFVMYRRTMISVFCAAFGLEEVTIIASLFNGSIYLSNVVPPENKRMNFSEENLRMCAWGYKFEQYMAADSPHLNPDIQKPVIENAEFSLCIRAALGNHQLLYAAQIDGLLATEGNVADPPTNADYETVLNYLRNHKYVELKTNKEIYNRRQEESFKRRKMLRCWAQCYLAGLHGLLVGYRNNSGIVQRLQYFETDQIVEYCKVFKIMVFGAPDLLWNS